MQIRTTEAQCLDCSRPAEIKERCMSHYTSERRRIRKARIKSGDDPRYYSRPEPTAEELKEREEFWLWVKKELGL